MTSVSDEKEKRNEVKCELDILKKHQEERAFLRRRFLNLLQKTVLQEEGCPATITLHESNQVTAKLKAVDLEFRRIHVSSLKTPYGTYPHATLRATDIRSISFRVDD